MRIKAGPYLELPCVKLALLLLTCVFGGSLACNRSVEQPAGVNSAETRSIQFQGTWTATGNRDTLRLSGERRASISTFEGSIVLEGASRPAVGFRAEAILFNDSETGIVGRAVWTDEHGERVFSELSKQTSASKISGTFAGGTGRYTGVTGGYEFSWRFLIENEDGAVQGQSEGLNGTVRFSPVVAQNEGRGARL